MCLGWFLCPWVVPFQDVILGVFACSSSLWLLGEVPCSFPLPPQGSTLAQDPSPSGSCTSSVTPLVLRGTGVFFLSCSLLVPKPEGCFSPTKHSSPLSSPNLGQEGFIQSVNCHFPPSARDVKRNSREIWYGHLSMTFQSSSQGSCSFLQDPKVSSGLEGEVLSSLNNSKQTWGLAHIVYLPSWGGSWYLGCRWESWAVGMHSHCHIPRNLSILKELLILDHLIDIFVWFFEEVFMGGIYSQPLHSSNGPYVVVVF